MYNICNQKSSNELYYCFANTWDCSSNSKYNSFHVILHSIILGKASVAAPSVMAHFHCRVRFGPGTPQLSSEGAV